MCLSMGEKNGPRSDALSCLFAAPFGVGERPVLIDSLVFLYLLLLPCSVSFFFPVLLGFFRSEPILTVKPRSHRTLIRHLIACHGAGGWS